MGENWPESTEDQNRARKGGRPASVLVTKPDWVGLNVGPALVCCVAAFELTFSLNQPLKPGHMEVQRTRTRIDSSLWGSSVGQKGLEHDLYESHPEKRDLFTIHTWSLK